jgi:hypothetical protein
VKAYPSPLLTLLAFSVGLATILGGGWIPQYPSPEELYGDTGRYIHEFRKLFLSGSVEWWGSDFLAGQSSAHYLMFAFPTLLGIASTAIFGDYSGLKIVLLICFVLSSVGVYLLTAQLTRDRWAAALAGAISLCSPQLLIRIADFEHYNSVVCITLAPFALWSLAVLRDSGKLPAILGSGLLWSLMLISYAKLTLMFLPVATFFYLWLLVSSPSQRRPLLVRTALATLVPLLCAVPLLLPLIREYQWVALFQPESLLAWQRSFSIKSLVSVLDRSNALLSGMPEYFRADRGQFYIGAIQFITLIATVRLAPLRWYLSTAGTVFRVFVGMGLFSMWLCHGPNSPFSGLLDFLRNASGLHDWVPALLWLVTLVPPVLIYVIVAPLTHRVSWTLGLSIVYYYLPGFLLLEILPFYRDIRAPWGFWEMSYYTVPIAVAVAIRPALSYLRPKSLAAQAASVMVLLAILDASPYYAKFFKGELPRGLFDSFAELNRVLRASSTDGRVYPVSGRYFYLRIPFESGRGLCADAIWSHFQMKPYSALFRGSFYSRASLLAYLKVGGISHLFVDRQDPSVPTGFESSISSDLKRVYESEYISLWENPTSLHPAFLSEDYIATPPESEDLSKFFLEASEWIPAGPVECPQATAPHPFMVGSVGGDGKLRLEKNKSGGVPFSRVPYSSPRDSPTKMTFVVPELPPRWLVVTEAWHPDWRASSGSDPLEVRRAFGGLMAVHIEAGPAEIKFTFAPPRWYNFSLVASIAAWLCAIGLLLGQTPAIRRLATIVSGPRD